MPTLGTALTPEQLRKGSCWTLRADVQGYARSHGSGLATQACAGRGFRVLTNPHPNASRVRTALIEDGYPCWMAIDDLNSQALVRSNWSPRLLDAASIQERLALVLHWLNNAAQIPNTYLWGGTIGPDLDCSGLVQTAFASQSIWLPRDAYQQERFCSPVAVRPGNDQLLRPGDLLFFGTEQRCTHVAIHLGQGRYMHSSGQEHGRNGIGIDSIHPSDQHPVACHYRSELRGAGRVTRCHDGSTLP